MIMEEKSILMSQDLKNFNNLIPIFMFIDRTERSS